MGFHGVLRVHVVFCGGEELGEDCGCRWNMFRFYFLTTDGAVEDRVEDRMGWVQPGVWKRKETDDEDLNCTVDVRRGWRRGHGDNSGRTGHTVG